MQTQELQWCDRQEGAVAMAAVSAVFESFARIVVCLDEHFRIIHTSRLLGGIVGEEVVASIVGKPVSALVGEELFGATGTLRHPLEHGQRREGWRASVQTPDGGTRLLSLSAAPFVPDPNGFCDPNVKYILILRPAEEDHLVGTAAPTVFAGMIARSNAMAHVFHLVQNLQASDATILLTGESGTGKEVLARAIHANSPRRDGRFVAINCAALPAELLESELFGHVRGAFTGAVRDRVGRFDLAQGGTLFLDEIGDVPLQLQVKLLRVLQERTFERVGESNTRKADVRIIAATHIDLRKAIVEGRFREDLYYRLNVVPIEIPPLRTRREDIEPLAHYLLARAGARHGRELRFSAATLRALLRYPWPGNVRELENAIEYAVAVGPGQTIQPEDLPLEIADELQPPAAAESARAAVATDRETLRSVLERHHWQRIEAARALGISRTTLWRRMREAGLA